MVKARIERQHILHRPNPPYLSVLLDAAVFHQPLPPEVWRDQLTHLTNLSHHPHITIRILPLNAPVRAALHTQLRLLSLPDGTDIAHTTTYNPDRPDTLTTHHTTLHTCRTVFDRASAEALTRDATHHHITAQLGNL